MEHETDSRNKNWAEKSKTKTDCRHREADQGEKNTNAKASKHSLQHVIVKSIDKNVDIDGKMTINRKVNVGGLKGVPILTPKLQDFGIDIGTTPLESSPKMDEKTPKETPKEMLIGNKIKIKKKKLIVLKES